MNAFRRSAASLIVLAMLSACGGQGDNSAPVDPGNGGNSGGNGGDDQFLSSKTYINRCENPRSGIDPFTGQAYPDQAGSTLDENNFLRSWTNETYLWYDEVTYPDPANYNDPHAYFALLKTNAKTASGQAKDKFHFYYDTDFWNSLSEAGVIAGYGAQWFIVRETPPREIVVAYVEPGSPAEAEGLVRGDKVLQVDGADLVNGGNDVVDTLNEGLWPLDEGEEHTFQIQKRSGGTDNVTMVSEQIVTQPVSHSVLAGNVGYILFNDHIATSEGPLIQAFQELKTAGVTDLVLDLRYNGGGYLGIASEVAYMVAGAKTQGQVFEEITFNDKHPTTDPITGEPLEPIPFVPIALGFDPNVTAGQALPTLDLNRVFVLTSDATCSASESIINSLRGIDVDVRLIGSTTCGKPYGFYAQDNCGTTYFTIQFQGNNAKGFGDYSDGFSPSNQPGGPTGVSVPGCQVADDFSRDLGDVNEARLAAALAVRNGGSCPAPTSFGPVTQMKPGQHSRGELVQRMRKSPFHENRFLNRL